MYVNEYEKVHSCSGDVASGRMLACHVQGSGFNPQYQKPKQQQQQKIMSVLHKYSQPIISMSSYLWSESILDGKYPEKMLLNVCRFIFLSFSKLYSITNIYSIGYCK